MAKSADKSLKKSNQPKLITFLMVNVILILAAIVGYEKTVAVLREIAGGNFHLLVRLVGIPTVAGLAVGMLSWLAPTSWKESLVFWRVGVRRLPSSEAFTRIAPADLRVDRAKLEARLGALPMDHHEQSGLWYRIYRTYSKEPAVIDAHAAYLLYREMTALVPSLLLALIVGGLVVHASWGRIVVMSVFVVVEGLIVSLAARNAGNRLVASVLAIEAANPGKPERAMTKRRTATKTERKRTE